MFETTQKYILFHRTSRHALVLRPLVSAFAAMLLLLLVLTPLAESSENSNILAAIPAQTTVHPFDNSDILTALSAPPMVHPDTQQLALTFVDSILPRLITDDAMLATQLGLGGTENLKAFHETGAVLDTPLAMFVVHLKDIRDFMVETTHPVELINNDNNWIKDPDGKLLPVRLLFPIKIKNDAGSDGLASWSSVMLEKTPSTPWRVIQVGGPTLTRAVKLYAARTINFMLWIPGINRHYLGHLVPGGPGVRPQIKLMVLFDDPVAGVNAGEEFDPGTKDFVHNLKKLSQDLQLQKRMQGQGAMQGPDTIQSPTTR